MKAFAIFQQEGVQIDQGRNLIGHQFRDPSDNATAIGVAAQHDAIELLPTDQVSDILDVSVKVDVGGQSMALLSQPSERRCKHLMSLLDEPLPHPCPAPTAVPGAMHEDKSRHPASPPP